jgi:hypothetical protein
MAITLNDEELQLEEGLLFKVSWTDPENVGSVGGGDPAGHYTSKEVLGYFRATTVNIQQNRTYAEAKAFTPRISVRKDMTEKMYNISLESLQINNPDLWTLRDGLLVQANYIDTGFTGDIAHLGPREPAQSANGFVLEALTVNNIPIVYSFYYARVVTEDISEARSGDDYAGIQFQFTAFPHPNFDLTDRTQQQKCYGAKWLDRS